MRVFLDFEASSLAAVSYPIEVGWVFEDGRPEAWLIKPAPRWTDWDPRAEMIHGIARSRVETEGAAHDIVARRMLEVLGDQNVYVTAPSWDGKWLSVLLRASGLPRHALRLRNADEAHLETAADLLSALVAPDAAPALTATLLKQARETVTRAPPAHRALEDAERERQIWLEIARLATAEAQRRRALNGGG
jgi:hypothetical protein